MGHDFADNIAAGEIAWIALDWGTSHLRAWAMSAENTPLARADSRSGMGRLDRQGYEPALLELVGNWLAPGGRTEIIACGMVGARQGWVEAPYAPVPWTPGARPAAVAAPVADARLSVHILPGLSQKSPADVMRGEETQIAGVLHSHPGFEGVVCLPGTHSKWAEILTGELVSFRTFMTGELFALLSESSVLRHSVAGAGDWDDAAFDEGLARGLSGGRDLSAAFFSIRAESLLAGLSPAAAAARLSGMLIGWELAGARPWWLGREVALVGAPHLCGLYERALRAQGVSVRIEDAEAMALAGLIAAREALHKEDHA